MEGFRPSLSRIAVFSLIVITTILLYACAAHKESVPYTFPLQRMRMPPGNLSPEQVPLFVVFGSDDNGYSGLEGSGGEGGMTFVNELFMSRRSREGKSLHYSFYVNTIYITPDGNEDPALVKKSWKNALDKGNEIAVHTHSHPHGREFTVEQWEKEIKQCMDWLTKPDGIGVRRDQVIGFRTPFIEYGDNTFTAARNTGFVYDCSIEEGVQADEDGRNFVWPYLLDHGSPGNNATYQQQQLPKVTNHPGLWEIPAYVFIVPPDEHCAAYGVPTGLRAKMKQKNDYFELDQGKITGFDWNLWYEYGMTKPEFLATLKYTLDLRLQGNRAPLTVGIHSDIYADKNPEQPPGATTKERREALSEFLDYVLTKPETRVVSTKELLAWLKSPVPISALQETIAVQGKLVEAPTFQGLGAGFRYSLYGPKYDPGPNYWAAVGQEMTSRFPNAVPEGIWIIGRRHGRGVELPFPVSDTGDPLIAGRNGYDHNEAALTLFDQLGFRVWLQIEPRFASVEKLLQLVLQKYSHHPSVIGVGIDVEWYKSMDPDAGEPVSDENARAWLQIARSFNPNYRLFLKHWLVEKMPPTFRDGLLFVDDSQIFESMEPMIQEFGEWAKAFAPAPVAYQYGYPSDRPWWSKLQDPAKEIGDRILQVAPNTQGLYWVDFSVNEVFPPASMKEKTGR